jgi:uncharacterized protein (TIGR02266 family)
LTGKTYSNLRRVPYVRQCRLVRGEQALSGLVCNISVMGVYVTTDPIPEVGERLRVCFPLPGGETLADVSAVVTWQNTLQRHRVHSLPPGCGVRFLDLSTAHRDRIDAFVEAYQPPTPVRTDD